MIFNNTSIDYRKPFPPCLCRQARLQREELFELKLQVGVQDRGKLSKESQ